MLLRLLISLALLLAAGCAGLPPVGKLEAVTPVSPTQRVGSVYLVRGFIGVFSTGIDTLRDRLADQGVYAVVFQSVQASDIAEQIVAKWRTSTTREPIVLIGHSYGADDVVNISRRLAEEGIKVDLLVTFDPVLAPRVATNVNQTVNFYQSNGIFDLLPWLRGVPLKPDEAATAIENLDLRSQRQDLLEPGTDHFNIEKNSRVHAEVVQRVLRVCVAKPGADITIGGSGAAPPERGSVPR